VNSQNALVGEGEVIDGGQRLSCWQWCSIQVTPLGWTRAVIASKMGCFKFEMRERG
jgi:hypothetical protein